MREKLIEAIEFVEGQYNNSFPTVEQLADGLIGCGVRVHKWIPVAEPPKVDIYVYSVNVLFLHESGDIYTGYANLETGNWIVMDGTKKFLKGKITHWMPLPEPPKEEK